ncbi:MAG TPA: DUF72 domain-containing protein, partial [Candidatus Binataceae bacterium]|nr:DUF72 domain-containing protein [Candidatus Binataceae bacterium]
YAERLPTVEINYTFRAMPRRAMLEGWAAKTPASFRFALKAPQRITHFARLRDTGETLDYFFDTAQTLGERLGPVLFQLPPDLPRDDSLLADFIAQIGGRIRPAFEFRNASWFAAPTFETLRSGGAALCIAETEKLATPLEVTASHIYLRLRKESYDQDSLAQWAQQIRALSSEASEIFIYFKHEAAAPELAIRLGTLIESE